MAIGGSLAPRPSFSSLLTALTESVTDGDLHATVRRLRRAHLASVVDAARCVAMNSPVPGASALARRVLVAIQEVHGEAALRR